MYNTEVLLSISRINSLRYDFQFEWYGFEFFIGIYMTIMLIQVESNAKRKHYSVRTWYSKTNLFF